MISIKIRVLAVCVLSFFVHGQAVKGDSQFLAFSLRQASAILMNGELTPHEIGGITRIGAMVYDREGQDIILVGLRVPNLPTATMDDLVIALRARLLYDSWPLVSIDPLPDSDKTKKQVVRFDGNIQDTAFGKSFLDSDIILKKYSLQMFEPVPEVCPYNVLLEDVLRRKAKDGGVSILGIHWRRNEEGAGLCDEKSEVPISDAASYEARFWFYIKEPYTYADNASDVFGIKELRLALKSECSSLIKSADQDAAHERFAEAWTEHFDQMASHFPELRRLKVLYDLTAVAEAIGKLERPAFLQYFLKDYIVAENNTDKTYPLEQIYGLVEQSDNKFRLIRISGGIEFKNEIRWLNYGDFAPLRDIVLKNRPSPNTLSWRLPLDDWKMQNARDLLETDTEIGYSTTKRGKEDDKGCSVMYQSFLLDPKGSLGSESFHGFTGSWDVMPPLHGVSMQMKVDNSSYEKDMSGRLNSTREQIHSGKSKESLMWNIEESDGKK